MKKIIFSILLILFFIVGYIIYVINFNTEAIKNDTNIEYKTQTSENTNSVALGYSYKEGNLNINYPIFIKNMNDIFLEQLIKKIQNDKSILDLIINIKSINGTNFNIIDKLISKIDFEYYTFDFDNYNDEDNYIFNSLDGKEKTIELDLRFNNKLSGNNTLIKTINNIYRLNKGGWGYFWITGEEEFMNNYRMKKEEIEIIHSMDLYGLYLGLYIEESKESENIIEKFILSPKFAEYSLFKKFRKGTGLSGIYKTLDNGEEVKIADDNERL